MNNGGIKQENDKEGGRKERERHAIRVLCFKSILGGK